MNYMLPILTLALPLAWMPSMAPGQTAQVQNHARFASVRPAPSEIADSTDANAPLAGQEMVAQAAQRLLLAPGLQAKTRQTVELFDQQLVGSGSYCQLTNGPKLYLELELKLPVGDKTTSLRQISDGDVFWEVHDEDSSTSVSYVNLLTLRSAASKTKPTVAPSFWMALGGLPRLLTELEAHFQFQPPQPTMIGELPVWRLHGEWKPQVLAKLLPEQRDAILAGSSVRWDDVPEQMPHGVTLVLGRDNIIPLFPYSFAFFRYGAGAATQSQPQRRRAIFTWELFEVRVRTDLQPKDFDFRPNHREVTDRTSEYLERLRAAAGA